MRTATDGLQSDIRLQLGLLDLDVKLDVGPGETVALLGPNGSGKTTALRCLAGLLPVDTGRVVLDGDVLDDSETGTWVAPERRSIGVVFQDYLLFPHLSALDNVAFGPRRQGKPKADARAIAEKWLGRMGLAEHASARPTALSGGQAQRVAVARALAAEPRLLLLDEPLAALDAGTRVEMRRELRTHLTEFTGLRVLVTHDPVDAFALADRVVVLENGRVVQEGTIPDIAAEPRSRYVAELVGVNLLRGTANGHEVALESGGSLTIAEPLIGAVWVLVRPSAVALYRDRPDGSPRNTWLATPAGIDLREDRARVRLVGAPPIIAEVTPEAVRALGLETSKQVWVAVKATEIVAYPV